MAGNRAHLMGGFNDQIDEVRSGLYRLLDFEEEDWSQQKELVKREVLYAINELKIAVENL